MGRPGRPEEVVELVHWILTASPEFMTGALIPIGGGLEF
jgi:NAD(P)-dependent dehydrogenase (short-subunit alcohol dehydrogenase family)